MTCFRLSYFPGIANLITPRGLLPGIPADAPIEHVPVMSVDCEATGTDPKVDRIVEIAIVGDDYKFSRLVNPGVPIPAEATAVHGITDEMVADAPDWPMVATFIAPNAVPLAYNAEYDRTLIESECKRHAIGSPFPGCDWPDPLIWARHIYGAAHRSRSLSSMCQLLGIQLTEAHRAANDARAALELWKVLRQDPKMPRTYGQVVQMQRALAKEQMEARRWR